MRKLIIILILILFSTFVMAQRITGDTLFFPDRARDLKSMLLYKPDVPQKPLMLYKTASVLVGTFLINEAVIGHSKNSGNYKNTTRITGAICLAGIITTTIVFSEELKSYGKKKLPQNETKNRKP